jgi:hypothetical protein
MVRSSPAARLGTLSSLPSSERALALRALGVLLLVRAGLALLGFRRLRARVDRWAAGRPGRADNDAARAVRRAVDRAARTVPGSTCLPQALAAELLLRRAGCEARVSIGVAPDGAPLDAHAWVESAGLLVTGDAADLGRYRTLLVFGEAMPATPTSDADA